MDRIYISSSKASLPDVSLVGGKARNLAVLSKASVNVPRWFSVTTQFFEAFMGDGIKKIDSYLKSCTQKNVETTSDKICNLIATTEFPSKLKKEISSALTELFADKQTQFFSVRSSAVDEDSKSFSFAGQLESYLYVKPDESIYTAIKDCFTSAYASRVMSYRAANALPFKGVRPAVIVQEMIFGEVSGVMFTGNPLNNDTDQILINAVYGIGEGIVSGELDADSWVVAIDDAIEKESVANKTEMITFDAGKGTGTIKATVEASKVKLSTLYKEQVVALAGIGRKIEETFSNVPQDIEWCMKDGILYILQSRPVTTLSHIDKSKPKTILDNSNIIESFPGVTSPLTFSFASINYEKVYRQFFELLGVPENRINKFAHIFRNLLCYFEGRIYYNLGSWHTALQILPGYKINSAFMDKMMGVKHASKFDGNDAVSRLQKYFVEIPLMFYAAGKLLWNFYKIDEISAKFINDFYEATNKYMDEKFEGWTNVDILKLYTVFEDNVLDEWKAPIVNDFYTMVYFGTLGKMIEKMNIENFKSIQNDLLCGEGEVESTKPTREIILMANWIRTNPALFKLFNEKNEDELLSAILGSSDKVYDEIRKRIKEYISNYGFRCMFELKLEEPSLKEDSRFLFTALKNYLKKEAVDLKKMESNEKAIRTKAEALVFPGLVGKQKFLFKFVLGRARKGIKNREELRFMRTKIFGICRSMFNRIGENLFAQEAIAQPKDVYFLRLEEIRELIEGRSVISGIVKDVIELRKSEFEEQQKKESPERMYFFGEMQDKCFVEIMTDQDMEYEEDASGRTFKGVPCSPGEITGKAKIVLSPLDADLNGEIMVAKRTDPGWVPLFPSVSGIIIERGSVLSHSAVVAREMGIPTIVGLRAFTTRIESGETLKMNGTTGIVERLDKK